MRMKRSRSSPLTYLTIFCLIAAGISIVFFQYNSYINVNWNRLDEFGLRGDAFGGLNAFFSGVGIAGIIVAIIMQSVELRHQRQELKDNTNSLLLTSYLNALESLRQCYAFEIARDRSSNLDNSASPELPTRLKYRLTLGKLEALVRHLEQNEKDLKQLEGAAIARSEHWLVTLKNTLRIFADEWSRELSRRYTTIQHRHQDGTTTERVGDVRFHDLKQTAAKLNNRLIGLLDEIQAGHAYDAGDAHLRHVSELLRAVEQLQQEAQERRKESKEPGQPLVGEEQQEQLEKQSQELRVVLDEFVQEIEASIEAGEILDFRVT